jgi:hypothetical protein
MICNATGCDRAACSVGYCSTHYKRWKKSGDPLVLIQPQMHNVSLLERWMSKIGETPEIGCWEWKGARDNRGYGRINVKDTPFLAHRLAYQFSVGDPGEKHIRHKCDNPSCVRPSHLQIGTHVENMADKMARGRHRFGTSLGVKHGLSKLDDDKVRAIRASTDPIRTIAAQHSVSMTTISDVRNRRIWRHVE